MIIRLVRMTIDLDRVDEFQALFDQHRDQIRSAPGCTHLELLRDTDQSNVFVTYSCWDSDQVLQDYRNSDLFGTIWPKVKRLFAEAPQAWSFQRIQRGPEGTNLRSTPDP